MKSFNLGVAEVMLLLGVIAAVVSHEAKDFDDSILYKIDFEVPELIGQPVSEEPKFNFYKYYTVISIRTWETS